MLNNLPVNNANLVALLKQKSGVAFSALYDCYACALFTAICNIVKDTTTAEDILQDTFIKIWRSIEQYDADKGALYTWMLNIAKNNCLDYLRGRHRVQRKKSGVNEYEECDTLVSPLNANARIAKTELRLFIKQLKWMYSEAIEMVFLKQYTHEETAVLLNIPLGTVKSRVREALKKLREIYVGVS